MVLGLLLSGNAYAEKEHAHKKHGMSDDLFKEMDLDNNKYISLIEFNETYAKHSDDNHSSDDEHGSKEELFKDRKNEFAFTLPKSGNVVTFKVLTHKDEQEINRELEGLKKINKDSSTELSTRLKYLITSVEGSREKKDIREFVENYLTVMMNIYKEIILKNCRPVGRRRTLYDCDP